MNDKNNNYLGTDIFWSDIHEYIDQKKLEVEEQRKKRRAIENPSRKCPSCGKMMGPLELNGVVIDLCASCGGVYLDKGELDLLFKTKMKGGFIDSLKKKFFAGDDTKNR